MAIKNVRSEVPNRLQQPSYRLTLESLDEQFPRKLVLPYNPETVSIGVSPSWSPAGGAGAERDRMVWSGNAPKTYSWTHIIQNRHVSVLRNGRYEIDEAAYGLTESVMQTLEGWAETIVPATGRPTRLRATMGQTRQPEVVISAFTYKTMLIGPDGYILTGEYDITLTESED